MFRLMFRSWYSILVSGALAMALTAGAVLPSALPPGTGVPIKPTPKPTKKCAVTSISPTGQCGW